MVLFVLILNYFDTDLFQFDEFMNRNSFEDNFNAPINQGDKIIEKTNEE